MTISAEAYPVSLQASEMESFATIVIVFCNDGDHFPIQVTEDCETWEIGVV